MHTPLTSQNAADILSLRIFHREAVARHENREPDMTVGEKLVAHATRYWRQYQDPIDKPLQDFIDEIRDLIVDKAALIRERCTTPQALRAYIHTAIQHKCVEIARKRKIGKRVRILDRTDERRESQALDAAMASLGKQSSQLCEAVCERNEAYDLLYGYLDKLPESLRKALELYYLDGETAESAAKILGCSPRTIRSRAKRALEICRGHARQDGIYNCCDLV